MTTIYTIITPKDYGFTVRARCTRVGITERGEHVRWPGSAEDLAAFDAIASSFGLSSEGYIARLKREESEWESMENE